MLKSYETYKETNIQWINYIPQHWNLKRNKNVFLERIEKNQNLFGNLLSVSRNMGVTEKSSHEFKIGMFSAETLEGYKIVFKDDLVINIMLAWNGSLGISKFDGVVSPAYCVFKLKNDDNSKFLHYLLRTPHLTNYFMAYSTGIVKSRLRLYSDDFFMLSIFLPPKEEQDQIVKYLEWQTSKINKLIDAKKKQIELLKEQKQTVINQAITKGLDPNVKMKNSGIPWLGDIPEHWKVEKLKQFFHVKKDIAGKEGYEVLSVTQQGIKVKNVSSNEGQMAQNYSGYQVVHPGEFVMNHMDLITGYVDCSPLLGVTSPDYRVFILTDTEHCLDKYFLRIFQICYKRKIFYGLGQGAAAQGRWRLPKDEFLNFSLPIPSRKEQETISNYLDEKVTEIEKTISMITQKIELIQEYKTCLVSDIVTGKFDVRDVIVPEIEIEEVVEDALDNLIHDVEDGEGEE